MDMSDCPFKVTTTGMPKVMAGRKDDQNDLIAAIGSVLTPFEGQDAATIIFGPRGVGKTSMVYWAAEEAKKKRDVLGRSEVDIHYFPDPERLKAALADPAGIYSSPPSGFGRARTLVQKWGRALQPALKPVSSKKGGGAQITLPLFVKVFSYHERTTAPREEHAQEAPAQQDPVRNMIERCRKKPLLILLDEAHTLPRAFKTELARLAYNVTADGTAGFHLVLAGTPGVKRWEGFEMITYSERFKRMSLDMLEPESTMQAITVPFKERADITVPDDVLAVIVSDSQGYPTFIQMWGRELWRVAEGPGVTLTMDDMQRAAARVEKERLGFYERRIDRIYERDDDRTYLAALYAAASAMENNAGSLGRLQIEQTLSAALPPAHPEPSRRAAKEMLRRLEDAGYVWKPYTKFKPGIPSFMSHVMEHVRTDNPQMAAEVDKRLSRTLALEGGGPAAAAQDVPDIAPPDAPAPGTNAAHRPDHERAREYRRRAASLRPSLSTDGQSNKGERGDEGR